MVRSITYELWRLGDEGDYTLIREEDEENHELLEDDAKLVTTFSASSLDDAASQMHEYLGWEPYKPM